MGARMDETKETELLELLNQAGAKIDMLTAQRDIALELLESALAALRGNVKHAAIAAVRGGK